MVLLSANNCDLSQLCLGLISVDSLSFADLLQLRIKFFLLKEIVV